MRVRFTGYYDLPETPEDRGAVDVWLLNHIENVIAQGPELHDIFEALELSWEDVAAEKVFVRFYRSPSLSVPNVPGR